MADYKKMYSVLLHAADDAATLMELYIPDENLSRAHKLLVDAIHEAEEIYIDTEDESDLV